MLYVAGRYKSSSSPGITYTVRVNAAGQFVSCDCKGMYYHGKCWHKEQTIENAIERSRKMKLTTFGSK